MCWKNRKVAAFLDSFAQLGYAQPLLRAALEHARVAQGCPGGSNVGWLMILEGCTAVLGIMTIHEMISPFLTIQYCSTGGRT